jgi:hypothetical protein
MISEFKIGNFKAFGPAQTIPLRPITLVFGPNSAGKSSIIHSLLLAGHASDTGRWDAHQTELGGSAVDLGGFANYVYRHEPTREVELRFKYDLAVWQDDFVFQQAPMFRNCASVEISYRVGSTPSSAAGVAMAGLPEIKSFEVTLDKCPFLTMSRRADGKFGVVAVHENHPAFQDLFPRAMAASDLRVIAHANFSYRLADGEPTSLTVAELEKLSESKQREKEGGIAPAFVQVFKEREYKFKKLEMESLGPDDRWNWDGWSEDAWNDPEAVFGSSVEDSDHYWFVAAQTLRHRIEHFLEVLTIVTSRLVRKLSYLGPLRSIPPRHLVSTEDQNPNWLAGGGAAWQRLRQEPELLDRVNRFLRETLHSQYRLRCQSLAPELDAETIALCVKRALESSTATPGAESDTSRVAEDPSPYANAKVGAPDLATALQAELCAQISGGKLAELSLVDAESGLAVSHRDVGTGISQLLPVLVNAAGGKNQLIAIEQPELHLHPALQAELGDVFIESALGENKNTFLIETHSEHLILRLLRRIRETAEGELPPGATPLRPEDVAVLYVKPGQDGSEVIELPVNKDGDFDKPWPDGFFPERSKELF